MYIKTVNTKGEHQCIIVELNDPFQVDRRKGYGPSIVLVSSWLPSVWIALTLTLTVAALKSFFYWNFD